jgi:hypothetical protein
MDPTTSLKNRREFVRLGLLGTPLAGAARARSCILIWQSGGLSQLDSFDPKPEAPREIRGEFHAIRTSVPGVRVSEHLPRLARQMHKLTLLRSLCAEETNHERAQRWLSGLRGTGVQPVHYPQAVPAVEAGARLIVVSAPRLAYDTHVANFPRLRDTLLPQFDRAFSTLLADLENRGLLSSTLLIATGEFGRSPRVNARGGRDHHARAWSAVLAGAGLPGGRVLGATDRYGEEVTELPVTPADLLRTVYAILGTTVPEPFLAQGRVVGQLLA